MPQIDILLKFASIEAAKADSVIKTYLRRNEAGGDDFAPDAIIPDTKVWKVSQDKNRIHNYLPGYFLTISLFNVLVELQNHKAVQIVINVDENKILYKTISDAIIQDLRFEPIFSGRDYPWGNWK